MGRKPRYRGDPTAEAYLDHVLSLGQRTKSGCLEWRYAAKAGGYGIVNPPPGVGTVLLSRFVVQTTDRIVLAPQDQVLHECDNPPCYERAHLRVGTNADNQRDADVRGRSRRRGRLIISDEQVLELRDLARTTNLTQRELGVKFGLQQSTVSKILNHKDRILSEGGFN